MFVEYLSSMYEEMAGPSGIPWPSLIASGHSIEENGYDPAYMDQYMLPASKDFFAVLGKLSPAFLDKYKTLRADEAKASVTRLMAVLEAAGANVWSAIKNGNFDAIAGLPRTTTTDALATIAANAANGAYLHFDGVMEAAMRSGEMSGDEVMRHAGSIVKVFQTFVDLDKNGHLDELKKSPPPAATPQAGLGVITEALALVGWEVMALGVAIVIGLCFLVHEFWVSGPLQKKALDWCDKIAQGGTKDDAMACVNAAMSMDQHGNTDLMGMFQGVTAPIVAVIAVGAALYMAPMVIEQFRKMRGSSRAA